MEIREGDKSIYLEFRPEGGLYAEWCDGLTRGGQELNCGAGCRDALQQMLRRVAETEGKREIFAPENIPLCIEAEHLNGYYRVKLGFVPDEDLLPWQWVEAEDVFREKDYRELVDSL